MTTTILCTNVWAPDIACRQESKNQGTNQPAANLNTEHSTSGPAHSLRPTPYSPLSPARTQPSSSSGSSRSASLRDIFSKCILTPWAASAGTAPAGPVAWLCVWIWLKMAYYYYSYLNQKHANVCLRTGSITFVRWSFSLKGVSSFGWKRVLILIETTGRKITITS